MSSSDVEAAVPRAAGTPTAPPASSRNPAQTKRRAQQAALELFSRNGYDSTSMREIAAELGVTKAALYYHFAGKEDIVHSLVEDYLLSVDGLITWAEQTKPTPAEVLQRWADVVRTDGLRLIRFIQTNQRIMRDLKPDGGSMRERLEKLAEALSPDDDSAEAQVRARLAMMSVQGAGAFSSSVNATEDEIFDIGVRIAKEILRVPPG